MARHAGTDKTLLAMALVGYEAQIAKINTVIAEIQAKLGHRGPGRPRAVADGTAPKKHRMSAAARKRIGAAQRKRWAAARKQGKGTAKAAAPKKKRKLSAAGRKAIIAATRKRWAAYRKAVGKKVKAVGQAAQKKTAMATAS